MKFLICGAGSIGERHIANLCSLGYENIILYRRHDSPLRTIRRSFSVSSSLEEALSEKPTAAIISNPTQLHVPTALCCAKAGCHLLIEKPLSHSLDGIAELQRIVAETGLIASVGFQFRFHPGLTRIKGLLENHAIGGIVSVAAHWGEYLPQWHPWEDYRSSYSARQDMGGGVILTLCHPFDYLRWLLGEISCVTAIGGHLSDLQLAVEDTVEVLLEFVGGLVGHLHLDYVQEPPSHWLRITGNEGLIEWNNADGAVRLYRRPRAVWETFAVPDGFERNTTFLDEMKDFVECIQQATDPAVTLGEGLRSLNIALAVKRSLMERTKMEIESSMDLPHLPCG